jgi:hypothetical protein
MSALDNLGLISREPGFHYLAYRIWLSDKGVCTLEHARRVLLDVPSPADVILLD